MPFRHALFVRGGASPSPQQTSSSPSSETQQALPSQPSPIRPVKTAKPITQEHSSILMTEKTTCSVRSLRSQPLSLQAAAAETPLTIALPGGAQGFRAALLARNWVVKSSGKARMEEGLFIALLLDHKRIPFTIVQSMQKRSGFDPNLHDSVLFFHRRGKKLAGSFGAVMKESWSVWNRAAYDCYAEKDRGAAEAFQHFLEDEVFEWLECEVCKRWRMYPVDDVVLPSEHSFFVCDLAGSWNPAIKGCETEQEYSTDSVSTTANSIVSPISATPAADNDEESDKRTLARASTGVADAAPAAPEEKGMEGEGEGGGELRGGDAALVVAAVTRALEFTRGVEKDKYNEEDGEGCGEGGKEKAVSSIDVDEQVEEEGRGEEEKGEREG